MTANYRIIIDTPLTQGLALGFDQLSGAFKDIIENSDPQFAIGLFGGWGSGKTTLMQAIGSKLDTEICAVVWFSAWRYEKEEHLIVPLLDVVREGILAWLEANKTAPERVRQTAKQAAVTVGKVIGSLLAGFSLKAKIPSMLEISYEANKSLTRADTFDEADMAARVPRSFYHASFQALRQAFGDFTNSGLDRRIVVFVDDLDRCLPEGTLEVLESMKLFFDIPGFVFVVGLDSRVVEVSVEARYRELLSTDVVTSTSRTSMDATANVSPARKVISGANYLRKIFQVPYSLAPVSLSQVHEFLDTVEKSAGLPEEQWAEINGKVERHLRFVVADDSAGMNPREVKRFINAYTLVRKTKPFLKPDVVLALQTIATRADWRWFQTALLTYREAFVDALIRHNDEPAAGHLENLMPELAVLPQSLVTYLNEGGPGHVLVAKDYNVNDYIYAGEATRIRISTLFLELFRRLGHLNGVSRKVFRGEEQKAVVEQEAGSILSMMQSSDEGARATMVGTEMNYLINHFKSLNLDSLRAQAQEENPDRRRVAQEGLREAEEVAAKCLGRARTHLQELYQAGMS